MAAPQPDYVVIGNCFDRLRDEVIKIQNQPGTAQQIANFAHDTNNCFDRIAAQLENVTIQLGNVTTQLGNLTARVGAVEDQLLVHNQSNRCQTLILKCHALRIDLSFSYIPRRNVKL
ncbi:uncharacterized protein LAJ45_01204 [Morchella importuna]|uniref:uncharacterized protein n=1 Tax=Morchella importuna TaxID=1174673 RepID=UPI001E8EA88A|nr:uncharacterized protein LAJ45_01204 [Morchella importuna]KAH8154675.1 hypothetical protein LAJ45_01204 [Morchella importuna]